MSKLTQEETIDRRREIVESLRIDIASALTSLALLHGGVNVLKTFPDFQERESFKAIHLIATQSLFASFRRLFKPHKDAVTFFRLLDFVEQNLTSLSLSGGNVSNARKWLNSIKGELGAINDSADKRIAHSDLRQATEFVMSYDRIHCILVEADNILNDFEDRHLTDWSYYLLSDDYIKLWTEVKQI